MGPLWHVQAGGLGAAVTNHAPSLAWWAAGSESDPYSLAGAGGGCGGWPTGCLSLPQGVGAGGQQGGRRALQQATIPYYYYLTADALERGVAYKGSDPRVKRFAQKIAQGGWVGGRARARAPCGRQPAPAAKPTCQGGCVAVGCLACQVRQPASPPASLPAQAAAGAPPAGRPITIVSLGGSVTAAGGYSNNLAEWLNTISPLPLSSTRHRVINWGRPAIRSTIFSMCTSTMLPDVRARGGVGCTPGGGMQGASLGQGWVKP